VVAGISDATNAIPTPATATITTNTTAATTTATTVKNIFGIGAYFPPGASQIDVANELVGSKGWVLVLIPCGNITNETVLPPALPGQYEPAVQMQHAWSSGMNVVVRLEPEYSAFDMFTPNNHAWVLPDGSGNCHMGLNCHLRRTARCSAL
jgi:hypothetical protein